MSRVPDKSRKIIPQSGPQRPAMPPLPAGAPQGKATGGEAPAFTINVGAPAKGGAGKGSAATYRGGKKKSSNLPVVLAIVAAVLMVGGAGGVAAYVVLNDSRRVEVAQGPKKPQEEPTAEELPTGAGTPAPVSTEGNSAAASAKTGGDDFQFKPMYVADDPPPGEPSPPAAPAPPVSSAPPSPSSSSPSSSPTPASPNPAPPTAPAPASLQPPQATEEDAFNQAIVDLHAAGNLLEKKEYPALRKLYADRFARLNEAAIKQGLGADYEPMMAWFAEHPEIQEELYTAIRPEDKVPAVMQLFNELRKQFPEKIVPYANLAIATAVVWDDERRGVYDYGHHASRCKATMPANLLGAIENFQYLVSAEPVMQGRIQYVPWEFLVYVVNHRTPQPERVWAVQNFVGKRVMYGKCYSDVPYDNEMLKSGSEIAKLNNRDYTLPNILQFGGLCAMQADFASRVGKSMGVAAEYVNGESAGGDRHAWVMWVELKQATPTGLVFSLESHGRYRGDKYYVGNLDDPQTGQNITDRDMELRLQTVGLDTVAKRHAALVMQAYPMLCERASLDATQRLDLLAKTIAYSPGCEEAWYATARFFREASGNKEHAKQYQAVLDRLFATFARVPDFTWKVFDDLAAYQSDAKASSAMYVRLCGLYEAAERPDLACESRLKLADMLVEQAKPLDAVQGLAFTIKKFPSEGRYVPKMLDKIELLLKDVPNAGQHLVGFYVEILPLVPQMRGDEPSPFAITMFERAVDVFTQCNQPQLAQAAQVELEKIKSGNGKRG
ncbi:MAG TPA: hypothetical protein VFV87_14670 [Pirellulaceae bacterium]|nr:hypothetical protein [Pirellulaceae bacterium]